MSDSVTRPDLEMALAAARWLESTAVPQPTGVAWPGDPSKPEIIDLGIYGGTTGVGIPLLELFHVTADERWLDLARRSGDYLLSRLTADVEPGLYSGLAGMGFTLTEIARAGGGTAYRDGAVRCVELLRQLATPAGSGVQWQTGDYVSTDIIAGSAGIGLFLLYAGRELGVDTSDLVLGAARRLVDRAVPTAHGLDWSAGLPDWHHMPNFSHGTAGIGYFLATASEATGDRDLLDAALRGAEHLQGIAITAGVICAILRNDPPPAKDNGPRYQLGWCHGATGTAAFWYRLFEVTKDETWLSWLERSARTLLPGAMPAEAETYPVTDTGGMMASVIYCHGSAGNAPFLLQAAQIVGRPELADFAERSLADCRARALVTSQGATWLQETGRTDPGTGEPVRVAAPSFSVGTAGVAYGLLSADAARCGRALAVRRPDDPFGGAR